MTNSSPHAEVVHFYPVNEKSAQINSLFTQVLEDLQLLIPNCHIEHIGSTAIPNTLSKGDLDVLCIVPDSAFEMTKEIMRQKFRQNIGTPGTKGFSSFECDNYKVSVGIQLMSESATYPPFLGFKELLLTDESVRNEYDELKRRFDGKLMLDYRNAKEAFICKYFPDEHVASSDT